MSLRRIFVVALQIVAAILILSMIWAMYQGKPGVSYGAMGLAIALVSVLDREARRPPIEGRAPHW
jgi:hypothetical protein